MPSWIEIADIRLHSGRESKFKIECDHLTDEEVAAMCPLLKKILPPFGEVSGVPRGGLRLEKALRPFVTKGPLLVVDDVWTTGGSVNRHITGLSNDMGFVGNIAVLFSRGPTPSYVTSLFSLHEGLWLV